MGQTDAIHENKDSAIKIEINNITYELEKVAKSASGAVLLSHKNTKILAAIACDFENPVEMSVDNAFTPLAVQYTQKAYAVGKVPGGFNKREGKPSEREILTARLIDRALRPLFPKGFNLNTIISVIVLSHDGESDLQALALNAASAALMTSELPLKIAVNGVRVGRVDGEFVVNPSAAQMAASSLDLFVAGHDSDLLMIEMKARANGILDAANPANELSESQTLAALELAKKYIENTSDEMKKRLLPRKKPVREVRLMNFEIPPEIDNLVREKFRKSVESAIKVAAKSERGGAMSDIAKQIANELKLDSTESVQFVLNTYKKRLVREQILTHGVRADGRRLDEIRPISIETNLLPSAHGSALFTRGQTQALVVATLGGAEDAQVVDSFGGFGESKERFLFHYNFPGFCVGEASIAGSPGRRELGHGNLAKKALESSVAGVLGETNFTIRLVSEILESNGSSSMASVCGGSLALRAAGLNTPTLIAGVAMGLVSDGQNFAVLTDIMGLEDHDGDMDFKVAGGRIGITALQMDIKLGGVSSKILEAALTQAKAAREHILGIMERAEIVVNRAVLPCVESFFVPKHKVGDIIGPGGKNIREVIEKTGASIEFGKSDGRVCVTAKNAELLGMAKEMILRLAGDSNSAESFEVGEIFSGALVKKVVDFGAFVELKKDGACADAMLHISKMTSDRNAKMGDFLTAGENINCKIARINNGKIDLELVN